MGEEEGSVEYTRKIASIKNTLKPVEPYWVEDVLSTESPCCKVYAASSSDREEMVRVSNLEHAWLHEPPRKNMQYGRQEVQ